ncbi:hypothetical protein F5Y08DRAFT_339852 [Xylaria arbuscula]|nr:hypothetical protein F5Y08DRAFT_339852 [Xylaria arbuscula]
MVPFTRPRSLLRVQFSPGSGHQPFLQPNMSAPQHTSPPVQGQFAFLHSIGATPEAVATLNDQPWVFFVLVAALVLCILEGLFIWYIHFATMKPEQRKAKEDAKKKKAEKKKSGGKPPAAR